MAKYENLIIIRNILYKSFFIGLFVLIIAALVYAPCKCIVANFYQNVYGISKAVYNEMWVYFLGTIKVILFFIFLVPAFAVHWVSHKYKKKHDAYKE